MLHLVEVARHAAVVDVVGRVVEDALDDAPAGLALQRVVGDVEHVELRGSQEHLRRRHDDDGVSVGVHLDVLAGADGVDHLPEVIDSHWTLPRAPGTTSVVTLYGGLLVTASFRLAQT